MGSGKWRMESGEWKVGNEDGEILVIFVVQQKTSVKHNVSCNNPWK